MQSEDYLANTPYLTTGDPLAESRFISVLAKAAEVRNRARATQERISSEASQLLAPYWTAVRSDLVAESNRIEGYSWDAAQVRELAVAHKVLLNGPVGAFMTALQGDNRVYQALGLYRAHELAESWARSSSRPREFEVRALHQLITAGESYAGRYKIKSNRIAGTKHVTTEPLDVPRAMYELSDWWSRTSGDPALDATVVHAWLTHIHPFEDGNGRTARLLANYALIQAGYPPLLLRSQADRGQYYDALAASDDGDILPLFELFVSVLRRTVRTMSSPNYVEEVVQDRLLTSVRAKYSTWLYLPQQFVSHLRTELGQIEWSVEEQGYPDVSAFSLLANRDPDGNGWYLKVFDEQSKARYLLWFGYNSDALIDLMNRMPTGYPSIFVSRRDTSPGAQHPYVPVFQGAKLPNELLFRPLSASPVTLRWDFWSETFTLEGAAKRLVRAFMADD